MGWDDVAVPDQLDPFREPVSPRLGRLGRLEPGVHWFTESTRPEAVRSREVVNQWYRDFPDDDGRFRVRLCSEVDVDHYQAVDELYVYSLLSGSGIDVRYEEAQGAPDFRIYMDNQLIASVEIASIFEEAAWGVEGKRHARLAEVVDRHLKPTKGYFVGFQIEAGDRDPVPRKFIAWLSRELDELPDITETSAPTLINGRRTVHDYRDDKVWITVQFFPMRWNAPARADPDASIVGMGQAVGGMVRAASRLQDRINDKAGARYELNGAPFLVAIGMHDITCSDDQVFDAIYGHESVGLASGRVSRMGDGLFSPAGLSGMSRHSRLSAVAVVRHFVTWKPEAADVVVVENPNAQHAWPSTILTPTRNFVDPLGRHR